MGYWPHSDPEAPQGRSRGPLARRCARGDHCHNAATSDDGEITPAWADPPSPFCSSDHRATAAALTSLPRKYLDLKRQLGDKPARRDDKITLTRTPPIPLRLDFDALMADMTAVTTSWEERVRTHTAGEEVDTQLMRRRRQHYAVVAAVRRLETHFDDLLALPAEPMTRYLPITPDLPGQLPPGTPGVAHPHAGYVEAALDLDGAAAGRELLALSQRARSLLGETIPHPERLVGVPCKRCSALALEDARPEYRSHCTECGHLMTADEYRQNLERWYAWAKAHQAAGALIELPEAS